MNIPTYEEYTHIPSQTVYRVPCFSLISSKSKGSSYLFRHSSPVRCVCINNQIVFSQAINSKVNEIGIRKNEILIKLFGIDFQRYGLIKVQVAAGIIFICFPIWGIWSFTDAVIWASTMDNFVSLK